jgi:hypothetical protein
MGVEVRFGLGLPEPPQADSAVTEEDLLDLLADVQRDLYSAASWVGRLRVNGWSAELTGTGVVCRHPRVRTARQAERRLERLGIPTDRVWVRDPNEDAA